MPTLRLKLIATVLSGGFMGMAGAPLPYYVTYLDPSSGFSLSYAVNTIAMPLIGGTSSWLGPLIGAVLLGTLQQVATVTISSALSLLIVGLMLVGFVVAAPNGIIGWFKARRANAHAPPAGIAMSDAALLEVSGVGKRFGGFIALADIELPCSRASASAWSAPTAPAKARW